VSKDRATRARVGLAVCDTVTRWTAARTGRAQWPDVRTIRAWPRAGPVGRLSEDKPKEDGIAAARLGISHLLFCKAKAARGTTVLQSQNSPKNNNPIWWKQQEGFVLWEPQLTLQSVFLWNNPIWKQQEGFCNGIHLA
jgi:hypothetical protein